MKNFRFIYLDCNDNSIQRIIDGINIHDALVFFMTNIPHKMITKIEQL